MKGLCHIIDSAELGHTYTCHDTGGADGTRTYADLHGISTCLDKCLGCLACSDVTHHDVNVWECCLCLTHLLDDALGMTVSRVDDDGIHTSLDEGFHALESVGCDTHTCCHAQTSLGVLAGKRLVLCLGDVLIGDESDELVVGIHHRELLNLVLEEDARCALEVCLLMSDHEVLLGHHVINLLGEVGLEAEVTIGHDADKGVDIVHHWNTADVILLHDGKGILHSRAALDGDRVVNHTVLSTFHDGHLTRLVFDGHVLVNHTDASLTGNGDGHRSLCDSVHSSCHERNLQLDVA